MPTDETVVLDGGTDLALSFKNSMIVKATHEFNTKIKKSTSRAYGSEQKTK